MCIIVELFVSVFGFAFLSSGLNAAYENAINESFSLSGRYTKAHGKSHSLGNLQLIFLFLFRPLLSTCIKRRIRNTELNEWIMHFVPNPPEMRTKELNLNRIQEIYYCISDEYCWQWSSIESVLCKNLSLCVFNTLTWPCLEQVEIERNKDISHSVCDYRDHHLWRQCHLYLLRVFGMYVNNVCGSSRLTRWFSHLEIILIYLNEAIIHCAITFFHSFISLINKIAAQMQSMTATNVSYLLINLFLFWFNENVEETTSKQSENVIYCDRKEYAVDHLILDGSMCRQNGRQHRQISCLFELGEIPPLQLLLLSQRKQRTKKTRS